MSDKKRAPIGSRQETHHVPTRMTRVGTSGESCSATAIAIETTAGRWRCKRPAETWCAVVNQRGLLIARA